MDGGSGEASETHAGADGFPPLTGTAEERRAAREAFSRWSSVCIGRGISEVANEHTVINNLLSSLAQSAPVVRGSESIPAYRLSALAADKLREEGCEYRGVKYACACVKSRIAEWAIHGMSANGTNGKNHDGGNARASPRKSRHEEHMEMIDKALDDEEAHEAR